MGLTVEKCLQAWTNSLRQMNAKADIVFFGDSLTYYGDFSSVFPDKVVCNLGLRGDTILGMKERLVQVKLLEPHKIYLMAGINDVVCCSQDEFKDKYSSLINQLITMVPVEYLTIQNMLPVNETRYKICCNNNQIMSCNRIITTLAYNHSIKCIDLYSAYQKEGELPFELTVDGIHLKPEGYKTWYELLSH